MTARHNATTTGNTQDHAFRRKNSRMIAPAAIACHLLATALQSSRTHPFFGTESMRRPFPKTRVLSSHAQSQALQVDGGRFRWLPVENGICRRVRDQGTTASQVRTRPARPVYFASRTVSRPLSESIRTI